MKKTLDRVDVAVVGSGFAGSIVAHGLAAAGRTVRLVERSAHPRFALGESSTPLASLALERLSRRPGLEHLHDLSTWGRWVERRPELRRGLKRGFTFWRHEVGQAFGTGPGEPERLLVAASPNDRIGDVHWVRADVDAWLAAQAAEAGVELVERTTLETAEIHDDGVVLEGTGPDGRIRFAADRVVDASGGRGFLARALDLEDRSDRLPFRRWLVGGHLEGLGDAVEIAGRSQALRPGPYPDERAAVHHLLEEGWMYVLPFDHGVASCGLVLDDAPPTDEPPAATWDRVLSRYPTLAEQFRSARWTVGPLRSEIGHRVGPVVGDRWVLLPHAACFVDPMFSTGMAWSLLGVERLLSWWIDGDGDGARYGRLLDAEADRIGDLLGAAAHVRHDMHHFVSVALLYFGLVSFDEVRQRLLDPPSDLPWCWSGFLAADEAAWGEVLASIARPGPNDPTPDRESFRRSILDALAPRDIAGWDDVSRGDLHPVDLDVLRARADRLGLSAEDVERALPRLRGMAET